MEFFKDEEGQKFTILTAINKLIEGKEGGVGIAEVAEKAGLKIEEAEEIIIELAKERKVDIFSGKVSLLIGMNEVAGSEVDRKGLNEMAFGQRDDASPEEIENIKGMIKKKEEEKKG